MGVRVRPYRNGGYQVDVYLRHATGRVVRERHVVTSSKSAAERWGIERYKALAVSEVAPTKGEVPTLNTFWPRFDQNYIQAEHLKPTSAKSMWIVFRVHLSPALGEKRLDKITAEDVQALKASLKNRTLPYPDKDGNPIVKPRSPKTINNILTVLGSLMAQAVEWDVIAKVPKIGMLDVPPPEMEFFESDELERLLAGARKVGPEVELMILLGADAGLRAGEMVALEWGDIDLKRGEVRIQRGETLRGQVTSTKSNKARVVELSPRLREALAAHRHMRGPRVLYQQNGKHIEWWWQRNHMVTAMVRAGLIQKRVPQGLHILRHTFGTRLAAAGVPAKTIQTLMGHVSITTTEKYMHYAPSMGRGAIAAMFGNRLSSDKAKAVTS